MGVAYGLVRPRRAVALAGVVVGLALAIGPSGARAFQWYDRFGDQTQGCVTCHAEFLGGNGPLHAQHRSLLGAPAQQLARCNVCHPNGGGTTPVLTYTSGPVGSLTEGGFGCSGCHGQLYGETSPESGRPKATSYGLRQVHVDAGVTSCGTGGCHAPGNLGSPDPFPALHPESVAPPYYAAGFSVLRDPCSSDEEEMPFDEDLLGLDNDGDGQRDFPDDADCDEPTPPGCPLQPAPDCVAPGKGKLLVNEKSAGKEKLEVVLAKIQTAVAPGDFGDPVNGTTEYHVCVYDAADELRGQYTVDRPGENCSTGKPCWSAVGERGYKFKDKAAVADGIRKITLRAGAASKGKVGVVGKSAGTMPTGVAAALAGQTSATVQLVASDGICVGATLPAVKKADGVLFKAVGP